MTLIVTVMSATVSENHDNGWASDFNLPLSFACSCALAGIFIRRGPGGQGGVGGGGYLSLSDRWIVTDGNGKCAQCCF